jgi:hypothetical protein
MRCSVRRFSVVTPTPVPTAIVSVCRTIHSPIAVSVTIVWCVSAIIGRRISAVVTISRPVAICIRRDATDHRTRDQPARESGTKSTGLGCGRDDRSHSQRSGCRYNQCYSFHVHSCFGYTCNRQRASVAKVAGFSFWLRLYVKFNFHEQPFTTRRHSPASGISTSRLAFNGAFQLQRSARRLNRLSTDTLIFRDYLCAD